MSQTLEIPDQVYAALLEAAQAIGITPADWIAAQLSPPTTKNGPLPSQQTAIEENARAELKTEHNKSSDSDVEDKGDSETERPWRGVFAPEYEREVLFTQKMEIRTVELPQWEPDVTIDPRWIADDE